MRLEADITFLLILEHCKFGLCSIYFSYGKKKTPFQIKKYAKFVTPFLVGLWSYNYFKYVNHINVWFMQCWQIYIYIYKYSCFLTVIKNELLAHINHRNITLWSSKILRVKRIHKSKTFVVFLKYRKSTFAFNNWD